PERLTGMNEKTTIVRAVLRRGKLYRELSDGREELMDIPPTRPMSDSEIEAAASSDPDNPPHSSYPPGRLKSLPRTRAIRRVFGLTQEQFAERFRIPVGTIRDWEQGRVEPDQAAQAYLKVIAYDPDLV